MCRHRDWTGGGSGRWLADAHRLPRGMDAATEAGNVGVKWEMARWRASPLPLRGMDAATETGSVGVRCSEEPWMCVFLRRVPWAAPLGVALGCGLPCT